MELGREPAPKTLPLSALRPLWLAAPVLPWLASLVPWFAPALSATWIALIVYFWPAYRVAQALGIAPRSFWSDGIVLLPYCLVLALLAEGAMRAVGRRCGDWRRIRRGTAAIVAGAAAITAVGVLALRYAQWIDWPARPAAADHELFELREHAPRIRELLVYEIAGGLIDRELVARMHAEPSLLGDLVDVLALEPVPVERVPEWFWSGPAAYWWRPPRDGQLFATADFPWNDRGRDGDHSCYLHAPDGTLWLWHKSNF